MRRVILNIENKAVNTLRMLSVDQIENANSGHPGLPLGAAPMAYALFKNHLVRDSKDLNWKNRDRSVSYTHLTLPTKRIV